MLPWLETRKKEMAHRPLIREQAFGEALDAGKLEQLGRYKENSGSTQLVWIPPCRKALEREDNYELPAKPVSMVQ